MDSYEFYLLYHTRKSEFFEHLKAESGEILLSLQKLLQNKKLGRDEIEIIFPQIIKMILNDTVSNNLLDEILEQLLTRDLLLSSKNILASKGCDVQSLRVINKFVNYALSDAPSFENFIRETATALIECMFKEGPAHPFVVGLLKKIIVSDGAVGNHIMRSIYDQCLERRDQVSLQNLCYFFDKMCNNSIFQCDHLEHISKYFDTCNHTANKQGVFLIKILVEKKMLKDETNWKAFTVIMEALEESSHLSLPTLELLASVSVTREFESFWFSICKRVLSHQASLVRNWGLRYVMNSDYNFNCEQVAVVLDSLNFTSLFGSDDEQLLQCMQSFISRNFEAVFKVLADINWLTVPFYHVLEVITCYTETTHPTFSHEQLKYFQNQTRVLPKKIKNVSFRPAIQDMYARMLLTTVKHATFSDILPILINIFNIGDNLKSLDVCLHFVRYEDYEQIFSDDVPYEFLKYALIRLHLDRSLQDMKVAVRRVKQQKMLLMEAICTLNKIADDFEEYPDELIHETIEDMWTHITESDYESLKASIEILAFGLKAAGSEVERGRVDQLMEMLCKIEPLKETEHADIYDSFMEIIVRYQEQTSQSLFGALDSPRSLKTLFVKCKNSLNGNHPPSDYENLINEIENVLDKISLHQEYMSIFELIEMIGLNVETSILHNEEIPLKMLNLFTQYVIAFNNHKTISVEFWAELIELIFKIVERAAFSSEWTSQVEHAFEKFLLVFTPPDKQQIFFGIQRIATTSVHLNDSNELANFFKRCLTEKIFEIDVMMRDQQIELKLMGTIDKATGERLKFRLDAAKFLHDKFNEQFTSTIFEKILEISKMSRKKPRYYANTNIHRLKLHHYQPLLFCETIREDVMDTLIYELLCINNQLNIQYLLEIIVSRHHENFLSTLSGSDYKPQALKSIFSIAIMQIKAQRNFKVAETMLNDIYHKIFPFSMGQNFGVRVYSLLAVVLAFEHVSELENFTNTPVISKIEELCAVINESVKQKNCQKYFNALKQDFRFVRPLSELLSVNFFYHQIPAATGMPFEEIIEVAKTRESFIVADMLKINSEQTVVNDEIEMTVETQAKDGSVNLQQKYIPFKYQIPGDGLLDSLPSDFRFYDVEQRSRDFELIVVASLVDRSANLGGLARTCEIFGASNYVIDSLKSVENLEFKSLSKTAEKWIKISEVKHWQLHDYLLAMKQHGYKIVGAEQSGSSVSLLNADFPEKCVLLLGNESTGVPANLLSLMDVIIEIPQCGVIRSLNVHVTGAILIWEYCKKFNLCKK